MFFTRCITAIGLLYATIGVEATLADTSLWKREPFLESRQSCRTAGWIPACPVGIACVPIGAICCDDGTHYAIPPMTCPEGTNPIATASVTVPSVPTITPAPTLAPPTQILTTYTYTITWYYYYYYYYYLGAATTLGSSTVTTETTIFITASDSAAALSSYSAIKATVTLETPTQSATSISGTPAPPAYPTATPSLTPSASSGVNATVTSGPEPTFSQVPIGAGSSLAVSSGWGMAAFGLAFVVPVLMVAM